MQSTIRLLAIVLLVVLPCVGGRCKPNPARPSPLDPSSIKSPWHTAKLGNPEQRRRYGSILYTRLTANGLTMDDCKAAASVFKVVDDQRLLLTIYYNPEERTDPPPMQLQILAREEQNGVILGGLRRSCHHLRFGHGTGPPGD